MFKAVIFDLDGLLIDSEDAWRKATAILFSRHNKIYTDEISEKITGMELREITEFFKTTYGFTGNTDELIKERRGLMYELLMKNLTLMPGVKKVIINLSLHNIPMAIATSGHTKEKTRDSREAWYTKVLYCFYIRGRF